MATMEQRRSFGLALTLALRAASQTQAWLGSSLKPTRSQPVVSAWCRGEFVPEQPEDVFEIERVLGLSAGELSRHLGFLPVDMARCPPADVLSAIEEDAVLRPAFKKALLAAYREFIAFSR